MKYYKEIKNNEVIAYYAYLYEVIQEGLIEITEEEYSTAIKNLKVEDEKENDLEINI